jgi:hypothetical protein
VCAGVSASDYVCIPLMVVSSFPQARLALLAHTELMMTVYHRLPFNAH